jgi:putative copper export protein
MSFDSDSESQSQPVRHFDLLSFWVGGLLACGGFIIAETRQGITHERFDYALKRVPWLIVGLLVLSLAFWPAMIALLISRSGAEPDDDEADDDED